MVLVVCCLFAVTVMSKECKRGRGCSSHRCGEADDMDNLLSTCMWTPSYDCYKTAVCEIQEDGDCGWTLSAELQECLVSTRES